MYAKPINQGRTHVNELSGDHNPTDINGIQSSSYEAPVLRQRLTREQRFYRKENNLCFYCGNAGHSAGGCPHANRKSGTKPRIQQTFPIEEEDDDKTDRYEVLSFPASPL